ncbi:MAG: hypothetical protein U0S12_10760 [Fimbriimonadales bacterium]
MLSAALIGFAVAYGLVGADWHHSLEVAQRSFASAAIPFKINTSGK